MACPACGCKTTYCYDEGGDGRLERCAACGHIFDIEDAEPEDEDEDLPLWQTLDDSDWVEPDSTMPANDGGER